MGTAFAVTSGRVLNPGSEGSGWWDGRCAAMPIVLPPSGEQQKWRCFYYGRPSDKWNNDLPAFLPTGVSGLAESDDGLTWTRVRGPLEDGAILGPSESPESFDHVHVGLTDVIADPEGSGYTGLYFGGSMEEINLGMGPGPIVGFRMRPGSVSSPDGVKWSRLNSGRPILQVGPPGDWDSQFVSWPRALPLSPSNPSTEWLMTYHALMPSGFDGVKAPRWAVGAAISSSGNPLGPYEKLSDEPILKGGSPGSWDSSGIGTRHVVHSPRGSGLVMLYEGVGGDGRHRLGLATSPDGREWTKVSDVGPEPGGPIFDGSTPDVDAWDNGNVGTPWLVQLNSGRWRLYYVGTSDKGRSVAIGAAESDDLFSCDWRRVDATC